MVTTPSVSYQPAVALQGEPQRANNTTRQEPKENQVQPKQAAAADSQSSDETSRGRDYDDRGTQLDIEV